MSKATTPEYRPSAIRDDWLATGTEPILEAELPIVDPHHHLWDFPRHRYLVQDLVGDTGTGHKVEATVFVECTAFYRADGPDELKPVGETEFVNGAAAMAASGRYGPTRACAAIVGFADLLLGGRVEEVLEAHIRAGNGRFRGIRHSAAWHADPAVGIGHTRPPEGLYRDARFREGFAVLGRLGLTFDAWLYFTQLDDVADLARAFPDQPIVLDHVGGPVGIGPYEGRLDEVFQAWRPKIREVARCPNVFVKLGGLGMRRCGFGFEAGERPPTSEALAAAWKPWIETCIEAFGPERGMFESNFPVDKVSCGYPALWNAFKRLAAGATNGEKSSLFQGTASRFYRIAQGNAAG